MTHSKRQLHHVTPVMRLNSMMKSQPKGEMGNEDLPLSVLLAFEQFATQEIVMFFTALSVNGMFHCTFKIRIECTFNRMERRFTYSGRGKLEERMEAERYSLLSPGN